MSEQVKPQAREAEKLVAEVNAVVLADPAPEIVPLAAADEERAAEIRRRMEEIDLSDTNSIVAFGSAAQEGLQAISQEMLEGVRNKDVGPAGEALRNMVTTLRGFSISELDARRERTWWEKLTFQVAPIVKLMARFETIRAQIDRITDELLRHEHILMKDIKALDRLYARTLEFYEELGLYIAAGEAKLEELDSETIPAKQAEYEAAEGDDQLRLAQELRDLRAARDDLERRVHDMKLTRQVTMQSLPSIRLVQENDKSLVTKINSTLVNTVPLWETQLAQALTIHRSAQAAKVVREATDLTNELLEANAANLREANRAVRQEMERGVFDIDAVARANAELIATIEESLQIADEGKRKRAEAEAELARMESELKAALTAARAQGTATGTNAGTSVPR